MTSQYPRRRLLNLLWFALGGTGAVLLTLQGMYLLQLDPFAKYRPREPERADAIGIETYNVGFQVFDGQELVATCDVDKVAVRKDRQKYALEGIRNGKLKTKDGEFGFESASAEYEQRSKVLSALKGARFWNADVDLNVDGFAYYRQVDRFKTVGKVAGKFYGGTLSAYNFIYTPSEKSASAGPVTWKGPLEDKLQDSPIKSSRVWEVSGKKTTWSGDTQTYIEGRGADGEIIVTADQIVYDRKTDIVTATGKVRYFSAKTNLTCEKAVIYRKEKRAVLSGNVTMLVKPKDQEKLEEGTIPPFRPIVPDQIAAGRPAPPSLQQADEEVRKNTIRKYPTQIWAERIEYWYARGSRRAVITGSPQARQDLPEGRWRHAWTKRAEFDAEAEKLKLISSDEKKDTRIKTSVGDDLLAKWLIVSTKEGAQDELEGEAVEGVVVSDDEDINNRGTGRPPPPLKGSIRSRIRA